MKHKILLVDDEPANLRLLRQILQDDYALIFAKNGVEAIRQINQMPDLVLLDVMMPEMNGHEVCRKLKADKNTQEIPVIFITTLDREQDESQGLALGAIDYITKPFNKTIVQLRVRNHLELKQNRDDLQTLLKEKNIQYQELVNKEQYISSLLDASLDPIISLDSNAQIVAFNPAAESTFGYRASKIHGKPIIDLFELPEHQTITQTLFSEKRSFTEEVSMVRKNRESFPGFLKFAILKAIDGSVTGSVGTIVDKTSEKQLAKLQQEKRDIEMVKISVETMKDSLRNSLNGLQLLRFEAAESTTVTKDSIRFFDQSIQNIVEFIAKMEKLTTFSEIEVGGVKVFDIDGRYIKKTSSTSSNPEKNLSIEKTAKRQESPTENEPQATITGSWNRDTVHPILTDLASFIRASDGQAMEQFQMLSPHLSETNLSEKLDLVQSHLDDFDFHSADKALVSLAESLGISL